MKNVGITMMDGIFFYKDVVLASARKLSSSFYYISTTHFYNYEKMFHADLQPFFYIHK